MKTNFFTTFLLLFLLLTSFVQAQTLGLNSSVQMSAIVDEDVSRIEVQWNPVADANTFYIYRKIKGIGTWSLLSYNIPASTTTYIDTDVEAGVSYEYKVKCKRLANTEEAFGYINAGGRLPMVESRGRVLLLVDDTYMSSLAFEIGRLQKDLIGDGWKVSTVYVGRTESTHSVKTKVKNVYANHPDLRALYLLGQVPVPYSGAIAPDGHLNHVGAWPTDAFYGDLNYTWEDQETNITQATNPRNHNVPFDGKYDHSFFPSNLELEVGRVDLRDLPAFAESEEDLLRYYLDKSHLFKTGQISAEAKAVVDDNMTGHNFSNSAWKGYSALVGKDNVEAQDYLTCLQTKSHLFSYGSGAGSYSSASGVVTTEDYANESPKGIFTMLLGSYFGEWNTPNNLLRAAIASGDILTSTWVGLPNYYFHHMAMGENIGYSIRVSQNNTNSRYEPVGYYARMVHMSLMGDPSLRMHYFDTAKNPSVEMESGDARLTWGASNDTEVIGYHVYRSMGGDFERITNEPIMTMEFTDACLEENGTYEYMVRALKLQNTVTGNYYNLSSGVFASVVVDDNNNCLSGLPVELLSFDAIKENNQSRLLWKTASETNFSHYELERSGDASRFEIIAKVEGKGTSSLDAAYVLLDEAPLAGRNYYRLKMVDMDGTFEYSAIKEVRFDRKELSLFPNPTKGKLYVELPRFDSNAISIEVFDFKGTRVYRQDIKEGAHRNQIKLNLNHLPEGAYIIKAIGGESVFSKTFLLKSQ